MACPPAVTAQATAFRSALSRAAAYRVANERLELLDAGGGVLARFDPQSQSLAGTWQVTGYNNGREAVVSLIIGTAITMTFDDDGRVSGSAGCNNFTSTYRLEGDKLSIGPAAATRRMCASPEGIMEQEQRFLNALETVANARLEGDRLEFRTAQGALAATLRK
jgi:heat shock protein HslJ